jgi:DNA-binding transcriptional LysR family regulator
MQAVMGRWVPRIYTDSIAMMKDTARTSDAVTIPSLYLVRHELDRGELKVLPVALPWIKVRFAFMYLSPRTLSPLAEALIQAASAAAGALQEEEKPLRQRWIGARGRRITPRAPERGGRLSSR